MQYSDPVFMLIGSWKGRKTLLYGLCSSKNLLGFGYRKQTTFKALVDSTKCFYFACRCLVDSTKCLYFAYRW